MAEVFQVYLQNLYHNRSYIHSYFLFQGCIIISCSQLIITTSRGFWCMCDFWYMTHSREEGKIWTFPLGKYFSHSDQTSVGQYRPGTSKTKITVTKMQLKVALYQIFSHFRPYLMLPQAVSVVPLAQLSCCLLGQCKLSPEVYWNICCSRLWYFHNVLED